MPICGRRPTKRTVDDVFAIQADVAGQIARVLKIGMGAEEVSAIGARPTANLEAWQEFLQARYKFRNRTTPEDMRDALQLVIARDPEFGRAHSLRAIALGISTRRRADCSPSWRPMGHVD